MNIRKNITAMIAAGVVVTGLTAGVAVADPGGSSGSGTSSTPAVTHAKHKKACSELPQIHAIADRMTANRTDRISIFQDSKSLVGEKGQARLDQAIERVKAHETKAQERLAKLDASCSTASGSGAQS